MTLQQKSFICIIKQPIIFQISDGEFPFDKSTSKRKGFCFLIFEGQDTAKKIIDMGKQTINGIEVL